MIELILVNRAALAGVLVLLAVLVWWLVARLRRPDERAVTPDVLDEGAAPAARNQALIDAPSAVSQALGTAEAAPVVSTPEPVPVAPPKPVAPPAPVAQAPVEVAAPEPAPAPEPEPEPEAAAQPAAVVQPAPTPEPAAPTSAAADDLSRIKGLGPKLQALLPELGITRYAQIAALTEADLAALDPKLGAFAGRPARDKWVEQARYLAAGDIAGFEAAFGKV